MKPEKPSRLAEFVAAQDAAARLITGMWAPTTATPIRESAFAQHDFAMGTAVGVRSWEVDSLGRLLSPMFKAVWTPDEMVAACMTSVVDTSMRMTYRPRTVQEGHEQSACACGFYAYYHGHNDYAQPDRVTGVIEGYGETQIGTRGFKSAKARIVALHVPDDTPDVARIGKTPFSRVRDNYGPHVAIYTDYARMAAEYPTTQPTEAPTPDTDPDFWTRGI